MECSSKLAYRLVAHAALAHPYPDGFLSLNDVLADVGRMTGLPTRHSRCCLHGHCREGRRRQRRRSGYYRPMGTCLLQSGTHARPTDAAVLHIRSAERHSVLPDVAYGLSASSARCRRTLSLSLSLLHLRANTRCLSFISTEFFLSLPISRTPPLLAHFGVAGQPEPRSLSLSKALRVALRH